VILVIALAGINLDGWQGGMTSRFLVTSRLPAHWPSAGLLSSADWLRLMDARPPGRRQYFRLTADGGRTLAGLLGYVLDDPDCYAPFNPFDLAWGDPPVFPGQVPWRDPPGRSALFPCLVIVQPGYESAPAGDRAADPDAVQILVEHITGWARSHRLALVAVLYAGSPALTAALSGTGAGWLRCVGTTRSVLPLSGYPSFDDYVAALPRSGAQSVRSDLRRITSLGTELVQADPGTLSDAEVTLRWQLTQRYGGYSEISDERRRLRDLLRIYPPSRLRLFRCQHGGDLVAFSLFITHGREWTAFWYGRNYDHPAADRSYFGSVFYAPVRAAIAESVTSIDYGIGHEESKVKRGCQVQPRDIWLFSAST
jgi:hypothetical protein